MTKALRAEVSARVLLSAGGVDGACNRAYYAMFDAARAALMLSGAPVSPEIGRTHSGLITAFGNYLVKNGPISKEVGRLLSRAMRIRLIADYTGDPVEVEDARKLVEQAKIFIATLQAEFWPRTSTP